VEHPKTIGDRTTLAIIAGLNAAGFLVTIPFGENTRYDLVIDDGTRLLRVQCKTGRLRKGAVAFNTCSSYAHHQNPQVIKRTYEGEIDLFGVYCPETEDVYLIPIEDVPAKRQGRLRVGPPLNNQRRRIRDASTYRVASVSVVPTAKHRATAGESGSSA
jgi:hypothetical protein